MDKTNRQKVWQAIACVASIGVLWIHLDDFGASEFSGGRITGKLFTMANLASLLFIVALLVTIFFPRIGAVIALMATLLCVPFYLHVLMPGLYQQIFKGAYTDPLYRPFVWDSWALLGILSLLTAGILSVHSFLKVRP
jgi:hypothetical protein